MARDEQLFSSRWPAAGPVDPLRFTDPTLPGAGAHGPAPAAPGTPWPAGPAPQQGWPAAPPTAAPPTAGPAWPATGPQHASAWPPTGPQPASAWPATGPQPEVAWPGTGPQPAAPQVVWATAPAPEARPPRRGPGTGLLVGALVACLVLGGGAVAWFVFLAPASEETSTTAAGDDPADDATGGGTAGGSKGEEGGAPGGSSVTTGPRPSESAPATPAQTPEQQALAELEALRQASLAGLTLDGRWIAQVASKSVGIEDPLQVAANGTHVFYGVDILAEHEAIRRRVADPSTVHVLQSVDFGRYSVASDGLPYWVTFVDAGFGGSADVQAWCARTFAELSPEQLANACAARTLEPSHP